MKNPHLSKQHNSNTAARPFADLATKLQEKSLDIPPGQAAADGSREDQLKGALVLPLHSPMVLETGTSRDTGFGGLKPPVQYERLDPPELKVQLSAGGGSKHRSRPTHR